MAIAFVFEAADVDQAAYQGLMKALNRESLDAPTAPGFLAHLAGPRPNGGWRVVDVWESEDDANDFYGSDVFQQGVSSAPFHIETTPWPIHRVEIEKGFKQIGD